MQLSLSKEIMGTIQNEQALATYDELKGMLCGKCVNLIDFEKKVESADTLSRTAKQEAEEMPGYEEGKFLGIPYKKGNEKVIIEGIQTVIKGMANAQEKTTEALKLSFDFEQELAKFEEFLFGLGCYNVAQNESLIDDLESAVREGRIDRAVLSEQVKARIVAVAKRLKDQQNILLRLQTIESDFALALSEHKEDIDAQCHNLSDKLQETSNNLKEETVARESAIEQAAHTLRDKIEEHAKTLQEAIISEANTRSIEMTDIKEKLMLHESDTSTNFDSVRVQMNEIIQDASDTKEQVNLAKDKISIIERCNNQFLNTLAYKISIGIIAIVSLVISILSTLGIL